MIDDVRELLKKIDNIVDSEYRRLIDQIDELQSKLNQENNINQHLQELKEENEYLSNELVQSQKFISSLREQVNSLEQYKEINNTLEQQISDLQAQIKKLKEKLQGLEFTIDVIADWIPSQKENISVLVALSTSPSHTTSFHEIHEKTTIPLVTLKNRVFPILQSHGLISVNNDTVKLTINK